MLHNKNTRIVINMIIFLIVVILPSFLLYPLINKQESAYGKT
ncbi:MAG: hypothetical protein ACP5I6_07980 [Caldisphaera sp.]|jgi:hypothetical protein|nr:hypothetical protein [Caldisphaera sp.]